MPDDGTIIRKLFQIDPETGILSTKVKLDREERQNYTLILDISDLGSPPQQRSTIMNVIVTGMALNVNLNNNLFVASQNETTNLPIHQFKVLQNTLLVLRIFVHFCFVFKSIFGLAQKIWTSPKYFGTCKRTRQGDLKIILLKE